MVETEILTGQHKTNIDEKIRDDHKWYLRGRRWWSFAHHLTLYGSAIASAASAIILQLQALDGVYQKDLASILAGLAALLIALNTAGRFGRKWQTNRLSASRIAELQTDLMIRDLTTADVEKLKRINSEHDEKIASE
jgi:hypothetical protein